MPPAKRYEVYVFGSDTVTTESDVVIQGDGAPVSFQQSFGPNELFVNSERGANNRDVITYSAVAQATADGDIVITVSEGPSGDAGVAGLALRGVALAQGGDFDDNGKFDCDDVNALTTEIAARAHNPAFDTSGDGLVDLTDLNVWLYEAGSVNLGPGRSYLIGDANLDGFVDGLDFIEWNGNKFTINSNWCDGDFNADGFVDGLDFIEWNTNKFTSADAFVFDVPSFDKSADVELAPPEILQTRQPMAAEANDELAHSRPTWSAEVPTHRIARRARMSTELPPVQNNTEVDDYFAALEDAMRR